MFFLFLKCQFVDYFKVLGRYVSGILKVFLNLFLRCFFTKIAEVREWVGMPIFMHGAILGP